ncbi:MAG TPA: hypothetical protein VHZ28_01980 [Terracidiphilus sp.]|nr:hypothetical protein [Terracidiphilus sp.]
MFPKVVFLSYLCGILCLPMASAQQELAIRARILPPIIGALAGDLAVAHVYVTARPENSSNNQINAYSVDLLGRLTPVEGSPFFDDDQSMSVNGQTLFAINRTQPVIDAYSIAMDGALTQLTSTDWAQDNPSDCGSAAWLFPDRTGADVYAMEFEGDCANNTYQAFQVQKTGGLNSLGVANGGAGAFFGVYLPASFLGNNQFAYEATNNSCMYYTVWTFARAASGLLTEVDASTTLPTPPDGYRAYLPTQLATDSSNHVAIALIPANPPGCTGIAPQIGSFTADASGNLTTTNTSATMQSTVVTSVNDMKASPAGNLLAIGGTGGLQVFHFNGADPPTPYTAALTTDTISQMFWDRFGHLYAISPATGELHVFTVTPFAAMEAPGSPYPIGAPQYLAVQSR